jgi:Fe-S cluster biogenesis protein NfuA
VAKEKIKRVEAAARPPREPKPKVRREPLPIKIKTDHHLASLLAEGSATDLTVAAMQEAALRQEKETLRSVGAPPSDIKHQYVSSDIPSGISSDIPSGIPDDTLKNLTNQQKKRNIARRVPPDSATPAESQYIHLDATRTPNEQKLYSNLLRDLRKRVAELEPTYGKNTGLYGYSALLKLTGIRSKTTIRVAIEGLLIKEDIEIIARSKFGTVYRIREPKEVLEARARTGIRIDPGTKWVYSKNGKPLDWAEYLKRLTGESRSLSLISPTRGTDKTILGPSAGVPDSVSGGVSDGIPDGIPESDTQVYQNLIHSLNIINIAESRGETISSNAENNSDDDGVPSHRANVIRTYEKYTSNTWRPNDDESYKVAQNTLLEVIEAGIISSVLRCPTRVNSFGYCLGAILEFAEFLPPGYVFLEQVEVVLDKIRPYIRRDGGDVELIAVEGNNVRLRLVGHCIGCPSSMMTLRYGIEQLLREEIAGFGEVLAETPGWT